MAPRFHALTIADVRRETPDAVSIAFAVPDALKSDYRFTPGQYLTLKTDLDRSELRRPYSICSSPDEAELRVAVKRVQGGRFSDLATSRLAPGQTIDVMTPMGSFGIAPDAGLKRTYVGLACGSGITPIISIIKSVLAREPGSRFVLLYGNRTGSDILFRDELDDLKDRYLERFSVFHVLSRETQDLDVLNGHLDGARIRLLLQHAVGAAAIDHAFICGPSGMRDVAETTLRQLGIADERIHVERFTPSEDGAPPVVVTPKAADAPPYAVAEIVLDGSRHTVKVAEGETILDAALRSGLELPYSCRGGMCCTCRAKIANGSVEMAVNYSLEPWEIAAGYALTCQARPTSAEVTVDYDHV